MLNVYRTLFFLLCCIGSAGCYASGILEGFPPQYFEAQIYLSEGQGGFVDMMKLNNKAQTLILTRKGTTFQVHVFDDQNPSQKRIDNKRMGNKPAPIYSSPELPIYPSVLKPDSQFAIRLFSDASDQNVFVIYGLERDKQTCIDNYCTKERAKEGFEFNGYMLTSLSFNHADSSKDKHAPTIIGFDGTENASRSSQAKVVFTHYSGPWDKTLKQKTKAFFEQQWPRAYANINLPEDIAYQEPPLESAQIQELRKLYSEVAATHLDSKKFSEAFTKLQTFFKHNRYQDLDKDNKHTGYTIWLTDYGYWLLKTNQVKEAIHILQETARRDAGNPAKYLVLADAQMSMPARVERQDERTYYTLAAKDNYRQYCRFMLEQDKEIKKETQTRIQHYLGINDIKPEHCIAHYRLVNAVRSGQLEVVQSLIDQGLNANIQDYHGMSLLAYAVLNNNHDMASLLLKKGADTGYVQGKGNGT